MTINTHPTVRVLQRSRNADIAAVPTALRSEWIKTRSLRSNPAILGLTVVVGLLLSLILAVFVKDDPNKHIPFTVGDTFIFSTWLRAHDRSDWALMV